MGYRPHAYGCHAAFVIALASADVLGAQNIALARSIREYARKKDFAGTILVARRDTTIYHEAFGLADRALGVPVRVDSKFKIASITKLFTATLVLQLNDERRLDLQAPVGRYLRDYAGEAKDRVTIHQLLNHTSGIENFDQVKTFDEAVAEGIEVYQLPHTSAKLLAEHASGKLVNEPGRVFDYNNADYVILGKVIEAVTGRRYDEVLQERILAPLALASTGMLYQQEVVPGLVPTYLKVSDTMPLIHDLPVYSQNWYAAGSMYSTTGDLMTFSRALFAGRLLQPGTLKLMLTPGLDEYGYGLWTTTVDVRGRKCRVAHRPGRIMGANVVLLRYLDDDTTVIILSNTNATDIDAFGFFIGRLVLR